MPGITNLPRYLAAILVLVLAPGLAAAEPDAPFTHPWRGTQQRADLITVPGSIWLIARHDGRASFHTNPRIESEAPARATEVPRELLAAN